LIEIYFSALLITRSSVPAEDLGTGDKEKITIANYLDPNRLAPEDIKRMIEDGAKHAEADEKLRERAEVRHSLKSYVDSLKNQINNEDKLGAKLTKRLARSSRYQVPLRGRPSPRRSSPCQCFGTRRSTGWC
jgi:heat shock protein 5